MIALVFEEQERETSILVSSKHTDYQFVFWVTCPFEGSATLSRGSVGWSSGQSSTGFPSIPTALCVGHQGGTGGPLFEKFIWFFFPPPHLDQCCPLAWVSGSSNEALSLSACSGELVPHPCYTVWEREATVCGLFLLHVFMWLRLWDGSLYFNKLSELQAICKEFPFSH